MKTVNSAVRRALAPPGRVFETREAPAGTDEGRTFPEIKNLEDLKTAFLAQHKQLKAFIDKANAEIAGAGSVSAETKSGLASLTESLNGLGLRLDKIEAKANRRADSANDPEFKSLGQQFVESADYKAMQTGALKRGRMQVKAIVSATGVGVQPLVAPMRVPEIIFPVQRILRIRQLIRQGQTTSNLVFFPIENVFTDTAGPQSATSGSPPVTAGENVLKNQSDITFTFGSAPVVTIATFILASRQVLDDAPMLQSYIDGRLAYALALEEERELLMGTGADGGLTGLMAQATAYNRLQTGAGITKLDVLRRSMTQLYLSELWPEFIVLNPVDWEEIELTKDTLGRYIIGNPLNDGPPRIWGLPVVATNSMTETNFLTANGTMAAQIWDRMEAAVELSREDSDNFRRNMVTILTEERLALTVYRPAALIKGAFTV